MALRTNTRLIRALREIVLGDGRRALRHPTEAKPDFPRDHSPVPLPRCTPEEKGLPSGELDRLYREIAASLPTNAHCLLVARHGNVVAEGYFAPYRADVWHVTHSMCKTITGTAVGIAIHEGLFGLDDPITEYFSDVIPFYNLRKFKAVTVRHLLTMSSGISYNELSEAVEADWLRGIFATEPLFTPGSRFVYNSMNSYLLSALVCRQSGQTLIEYLSPRLFEPMGFGPIAWERSAEGYEKGGWGMYIMPEDMVKFGQLYLQNGRWQVGGQTRQLVPEEWVRQATTTQITGSSEQEYGFHIWTDSKGGSYVMHGMFGQYIAVCPRLDIVVAMTAGNLSMSPGSSAFSIMQEFFRIPLPQNSLPQNAEDNAQLQFTLNNLHCRRPVPEYTPPAPPRRWWQFWRKRQAPPALPAPSVPPAALAFCGTTWRFTNNRASMLPVIPQTMNNNFTSGVKAVRLEEMEDHVNLYWEEDEGTLCVPIGFGKALHGTLRIGRETYVIAAEGEVRQNEDSEDVLKIQVSLLEHSSSRLLKLVRRGDKLLLRADEAPQLSTALETALSHNATTTGDSSTLGRLLRGNDYLYYRIAQLCTPELTGQPVRTARDAVPEAEDEETVVEP